MAIKPPFTVLQTIAHRVLCTCPKPNYYSTIDYSYISNIANIEIQFDFTTMPQRELFTINHFSKCPHSYLVIRCDFMGNIQTHVNSNVCVCVY